MNVKPSPQLISDLSKKKKIVWNPKLKKSLSPSSKKWLRRQLRDQYVVRAHIEDYRCRSAYKLIEINEKYKIFKPGQVVVDLGCAPGSWTQVAVKATQAKDKWFKSLVIGLDLRETEPIEGAKILDDMDFLEKDSQKLIKKALENRRADVVLSDMAPNTTGMRFRDHILVSELCYQTLRFVPKIAKQGATLVMKAFDGEECQQIIKDVRYLFERGVVFHPKATRQPSSEFFYVGLKYKGSKLPPRNENVDND